MHAVVVTVRIVPDRFEESHKALKEQVIPRVRQAPGLVKGFWTVSPDKTKGLSMVVFQSQQQAETAANGVRSNPLPPGVTLDTMEIREIVAEA
jgi:hypothetical protein